VSLYDSKTYLDDLRLTIEKNKEIFDALRNRSVLVTGASGAVCSPVVDLLLFSDRNIKVYAAGRNREKMDRRFVRWTDDPHYCFVSYDATKKNQLDFSADYVIHGASNSAPTDISSHGIETMLDNFMGTYELLNYAEIHKCQNFLYISSSEVYGRKTDPAPFTEDEYGWVDILNPRSSYPSSKRAAETMCACFSQERHVKTTVVRPGHIYGPTAGRRDTHVADAFAYRAADGKDLVMNSAGKQLRSWCYSIDCASAILTVLVRGKEACAYNISNRSGIASIRDMAELLAGEAGVRVMVHAVQQDSRQVNPMDNSSLNAEKLEQLGWQGLYSAATGFAHTIKIIREGNL